MCKDDGWFIRHVGPPNACRPGDNPTDSSRLACAPAVRQDRSCLRTRCNVGQHPPKVEHVCKWTKPSSAARHVLNGHAVLALALKRGVALPSPSFVWFGTKVVEGNGKLAGRADVMASPAFLLFRVSSTGCGRLPKSRSARIRFI